MNNMVFTGFGKGAQRFFRDLAANNDKPWFQENQGRYERELLEPAVAFVNALGPRLAELYPSINYGSQRNGSGSIMRIHRDVRSSQDCAFFYGGQHLFPKPVLERYRAAVDDEAAGTVLVKTLQKLERKGLRVLEEPAYKRVPQVFSKDYARGELLRYGGIGVSADLPKAALTGADLLGVCADFALKVRPLIDWLRALND